MRGITFMVDTLGNIGFLNAGSMAELASALEQEQVGQTELALLQATLAADAVDDPDLLSALEMHGAQTDLRETIVALLRDPKRRHYLAKAQFRLGSLFSPRARTIEPTATFVVVHPSISTQPTLLAGTGTNFQDSPVHGAILCMSRASRKDKGEPLSLSRRTSPRVGLFAKLGGEIARLRVDAKLTQSQLAKKLGVHNTNLARIESGRVAGWKHHVALAKIFGLEEDYFQKKLRRWGLPGTEIEYRNFPDSSVKKGKYAVIGEELKQLREAKGWTRKKLAELAQTNITVILQMELGRSIAWSALSNLERVLGLEEGHFVNRLKALGLPDSKSKVATEAKSKRFKRESQKRKWIRLGKEIKRLKLDRRWSDHDLAEKLKIERSLLRQIIMGIAPGFKHHSALEKAFGLKNGYFAQKLKEWGLPQSRAQSMTEAAAARHTKPKGKYASIGIVVRKRRIAKEWTQQGLALQVGVSQPEIAAIENGILTGRRYYEKLERLLELKSGTLQKLLDAVKRR